MTELVGDSDSWRDIGHARWYDPLAPLEDPKSSEFEAAVEDEATRFSAALEPFDHKATTAAFKAILNAAQPKSIRAAQELMLWHQYTIHIQHSFGHRLNVWITEGTRTVKTFDDIDDFGVDAESDKYYTIQDVGNGSQAYELRVFSVEEKAPLYKISGVQLNATFTKDYLYYHTLTAVFRANKANGLERKQIYAERNKRFQIDLLTPPNQNDIFLYRYNALSQQLGCVSASGIKMMTDDPPADGKGTTLIPIAEELYASDKHLHDGSHAHKLPKGSIQDAILLTPNVILVCVTKDAILSLYLFDRHAHKFTPLYIGKSLNNIMIHKYSTAQRVTITAPNTPNTVFEIQDGALIPIRRAPEPLKLTRYSTGYARAEDGTRIPYSFVSAVKTPRKLLVEAYGAYGISSHRSYPSRWLPWLKRGYAFVEVCARGGREDGDAWYDAARTAARKKTTFEDVAAAIKEVQRRYGFGPENTVFYGRSAGGWLAAYIGQKYPDRVAGIYAEVPYLDVLRTTTNPELPLTVYEYDEFGDPATKPNEYEALQTLSPVDSATLAPPDAPLFLVRTAINDYQVFAYEALKFAKKMRGLGWPVLVGMDNDGGHFVKTQNMYEQFAADYLILNAVIKPARTHTRKLRSQIARGRWPRRTSSRKHSTKH